MNRGQVDSPIKFIARARDLSLLLAPAEARLVLHWPGALNAAISMQWVGANQSPEITGVQALPGRINYLAGNDPRKWKTDIPTYAGVLYEEIYPGISLTFDGNPNKLEYDFLVSAGADPKAIRLRFQGARGISLDRNGNLVLKTSSGDVQSQTPFAYQKTGGSSREVPATTNGVVNGYPVSSANVWPTNPTNHANGTFLS